MDSVREGLRAVIIVALAIVAIPGVSGAQARYDLVITGGTVVDGTGSPRFAANIAVNGDRIVLVSRTPIAAALARRMIDARGLIVAPGFIDLHAHLDPLLQMPDAQSAARQGVTLALGGPDGGGPWPFGAYLDSRRQRSRSASTSRFSPDTTRFAQRVMGTANRAPTPAELHAHAQRWSRSRWRRARSA